MRALVAVVGRGWTRIRRGTFFLRLTAFSDSLLSM